MKRIYEPAAYRTPEKCWWRDSAPPRDLTQLDTDLQTDVAIIGGGFTGLNAALGLAEAGTGSVVLDAAHPGWGASGRNGGFCCLGGAKASHAAITRAFGRDQAARWQQAQRAAVDHVAAMLGAHDMDVDRHSEGETFLAHSPRAMKAVNEAAALASAHHGVTPHVFGAEALPQLGLAGKFHGGVTVPIGFALNPGKYHAGLLDAALRAGVRCFAGTAATAITRVGQTWRVTTAQGTVTAGRILLATNGYSSEDVPPWLRARYLPVQSSIIVTRPITREEQERQGWTSVQMCYDTRALLHYFRLMPDGRFLFGMRGGLAATPASEKALARKIRSSFHRLFPEWQGIGITHEWSGLLCLMRRLTPFAGPVPDMPGVYAALGYHGNGVAMASYCGTRIADQLLGRPAQGPFPQFLTAPPRRFPLGRFRRALLAPAYAGAALMDG
ncbi:FAD-binding oxidoreductase [Marivita sp. GX14005]|uniref:NAD(P)/FAD-dependent oxidoreductase n=1 Tax=Marivita sp. GX14005 TaxID=2942276 RepID=UPI002018D38D|nr:FAD-binding oxidoreductase [Marivita sp. GX14005]MCL3881331.1 FAD-binding oxidoreductase [Marivita sp. GX14005]